MTLCITDSGSDYSMSNTCLSNDDYATLFVRKGAVLIRDLSVRSLRALTCLAGVDAVY